MISSILLQNLPNLQSNHQLKIYAFFLGMVFECKVFFLHDVFGLNIPHLYPLIIKTLFLKTNQHGQLVNMHSYKSCLVIFLLVSLQIACFSLRVVLFYCILVYIFLLSRLLNLGMFLYACFYS